jgi:hypothetical protein
MEPTHGDYDIENVDGINSLISRMDEAETIRDWSMILSDYMTFGNSKISKKVGIFNMNSATDCPNAKTAKCQVRFENCYAHKAEKIYDAPLDYRRRQEFLWDSMDAKTFAEAFRKLVSRKRNNVSAIRFSEAGDFRHRGDIIKVDRIAELLGSFDVYTYSASSDLDWSHAEHFTVNQSNDFADYGDRLYSAVSDVEDIPEDAIQCPYDRTDGEIKCGTCRACIEPNGPDVYITLH